MCFYFVNITRISVTESLWFPILKHFWAIDAKIFMLSVFSFALYYTLILYIYLKTKINILNSSRFLPIPDPGIKKAPDPGSGSATLAFRTKKGRKHIRVIVMQKKVMPHLAVSIDHVLVHTACLQLLRSLQTLYIQIFDGTYRQSS